MSEITDFLNKTASVSRLRSTDVSKTKQEYYSYATAVPVRLESLSDGDIMFAEGDITQSYKVYAELGAFIATDKLTIDSVAYYVEGVRKFDGEYGGHIEAIVHETRALDA